MKGGTESGVTLIEVLVSMAVASITLAGAMGLLAASARAVVESELETTAVIVASRTIEEWRSQSEPSLDGRVALDRNGAPAAGAALLEASWTARPDAGAADAWRVVVTVTSPRLRTPVIAEAVVQRVIP